MEEILHDLLKEDKNLLLRREELVRRMEPLVAGRFIRNLRPIENALQQKVGEIFLSADGGDREQRLEAAETSRKVLLKSGMQEKRVLYVLKALETALEWDREPAPPEKGPGTSAGVSLGKQEKPHETEEAEPGIAPAVDETVPLYQESSFREEDAWVCSCGTLNRTPTCTWCGKKNPAVAEKADADSPAQYLRLPKNIWGQSPEARKKRTWGKFLRNAALLALAAIALLSILRTGRSILPQLQEQWKASFGTGAESAGAPSDDPADAMGAERAFLNFHKAVTNKNFRDAYGLLSREHHQGADAYKDFAKSYATTISSVVDGVKVVSAEPGQVALSYRLIANDRAEDGRTKIQSFDGTAVMVLEEGRWRIRRSDLKKTGERME